MAGSSTAKMSRKVIGRVVEFSNTRRSSLPRPTASSGMVDYIQRRRTALANLLPGRQGVDSFLNSLGQYSLFGRLLFWNDLLHQRIDHGRVHFRPDTIPLDAGENHPSSRLKLLVG